MMRLLTLSFFLSLPVWGQNLMDERIWKIAARKKSIFLDAGVFHLNSQSKNSSIVAIRSSATPGQGYERVVIDFNTPTVPKLYGHISPSDKKIAIDFFDTGMSKISSQLKNSLNVKSINFIKIDNQSITMDLVMKQKVSFDIFYLENPGRLVIDIR